MFKWIDLVWCYFMKIYTALIIHIFLQQSFVCAILYYSYTVLITWFTDVSILHDMPVAAVSLSVSATVLESEVAYCELYLVNQKNYIAYHTATWRWFY